MCLSFSFSLSFGRDACGMWARGVFVCFHDDAVRCMTGVGEAKRATSAWVAYSVGVHRDSTWTALCREERDSNVFGCPIRKISLTYFLFPAISHQCLSSNSRDGPLTGWRPLSKCACRIRAGSGSGSAEAAAPPWGRGRRAKRGKEACVTPHVVVSLSRINYFVAVANPSRGILTCPAQPSQAV